MYHILRILLILFATSLMLGGKCERDSPAGGTGSTTSAPIVSVEDQLRMQIVELEGKKAELKELLAQKNAQIISTTRTYLTIFGLIISIGSVIVLAIGLYYNLSLLKKISVFCSIVGITLLVIAKVLPYLDAAITGVIVISVFSLLGIGVYYGIRYVLKLNKSVTAVYAFGDDIYSKLDTLVKQIKDSSVKAFASDADKTEYIHNMIKMVEDLSTELDAIKLEHKDSQVKAGVHKEIQEARRAITTK